MKLTTNLADKSTSILLFDKPFKYSKVNAVELVLDNNCKSPLDITVACKKDDGVVVTSGAIRRANLHQQQTNSQLFFIGRMPSSHPTDSIKALNGNYAVTVS